MTNNNSNPGTYQKLVMLPGPTNVPIEVMQAMISPSIGHRSADFGSIMKNVTTKGNELLETNEDIIVLTSSGTGAVEASVFNLLQSGDKALVTVCGEFGGRVSEQIEYAGATSIQLDSGYGEFPTLADVERAFETNKDVKALYVVTNETSSGAMCKWLKEAGELTVKHDAYLIADAVSNWGADEMPMKDFNIDIVATCSQKAIACPPGLGLVGLSTRAKDFMLKNPPSRHYFNLPRYMQYSAKLQTPFTPVLPLYFALDKAFDLMIDEGLSDRYVRHQICGNALYDAFSAMGLEHFANPVSRSNTVISITYPHGIDDGTFRKRLAQKYGVIIAGGFGDYVGKLFRVGSMGIVHKFHILTTVSAIGYNLRDMGFNANVDKGISAALDALNQLP